VLNEVQRYIETNGGATESEMKAIWNSLSCAITDSERRQPTAEGAEEILVKRGFFVMTHKEGSEHVRKAFIEPVIAAMTEFATLHARKMARENLREELIDFGHAMFPDESLQNIKHYVDTHLKSKEQ
jgi:hypothetical protein